MDKALEWEPRIPIGLLYRNPNPRPPLDALDPALLTGQALVHQSFDISQETRRELIHEFM